MLKIFSISLVFLRQILALNMIHRLRNMSAIWVILFFNRPIDALQTCFVNIYIFQQIGAIDFMK